MSSSIISFNPSVPPGSYVRDQTLNLAQAWSPRIVLSNDGGNSFYRFGNILGKTISFDVDVSSTHCSCNAALYFISPPPGTPITGYCDGQTNCTEIDVMETNSHAFQVTPHCGTGGDACHWGCGQNFRQAAGFGPGGSAVDTNHPFHVFMKFVSSDMNTLNALSGGIMQSGKSGISYSLTDSSCTNLPGNPKTYISGLSKDVRENLVLTISFWHGDMNWLDGCSAGQTCPDSCNFTVGNFTVY